MTEMKSVPEDEGLSIFMEREKTDSGYTALLQERWDLNGLIKFRIH